MADWVNITDAQVDPDAPLTSEIAYAWRDNPIAIAEGAPGAPRIKPRSLDGASAGNVEKILFADGSVSSGSTTPVNFFTTRMLGYGTLRARCTIRAAVSSSNGMLRLIRTRYGLATTLLDFQIPTSDSTQAVDVSYVPGDELSFGFVRGSVQVTWSSVSFSTGGEDIFFSSLTSTTPASITVNNLEP